MKDPTHEEGVFSIKNFKILIFFFVNARPLRFFYLSYICLIGFVFYLSYICLIFVL